MKELKQTFLAVTLLITSIMSAQNFDKQDLKIFPKAEKGFQQVVIDLPHSDSDNNKKVEIYVGKVMETDSCNKYFLAGELITNTVKGFGYDYFTFKTDGNVASTMMACMDNTKKSQFITSTPFLTRYNGLLPIVIYIPEGFEVRYKLYETTNEMFYAPVNKS